MIETLRHARRQLTAAQARCQYPTPEAQYRVADAEAKLTAAEKCGKGYAAAISAVATALVELESSR